ncbi:hypothetical protein H5410_028566 [Solanum commersonii]|uniref:MADS-box domain-containing protein n=1 Tax=Solanum commersonii TaxID=4109 RepID=A0A9J5Z316_SOLCO|nr:hypothetical protein H5410_028566 [Solanum commersonii]
MEKRTNRGKQKIEIKLIDSEEVCIATFPQRKNTLLFKKADKLSTLSRANVCVLLSSPSGKPYSYGFTNIEKITVKLFELKLHYRHRDHADVGK